jgi:hypothetical protein
MLDGMVETVFKAEASSKPSNEAKAATSLGFLSSISFATPLETTTGT